MSTGSRMLSQTRTNAVVKLEQNCEAEIRNAANVSQNEAAELREARSTSAPVAMFGHGRNRRAAGQRSRELATLDDSSLLRE
jgi:hypothetical protein